MKLSTRGCYGLKALMVLARNYGAGPVLMKEISEEHGLSLKYLYLLLNSLKTAGIVRSVRGVGGGFVLARAPSGITVLEAVRALEGSLAPAECVEDQEGCRCSSVCVALDLWQELNRAIEKILAGITLEDLVNRQAEVAARRTEPPVYQI